MQQTILTCLFVEVMDLFDFKFSKVRGRIAQGDLTVFLCSAGRNEENCENCDLWTEIDPMHYEDLIKKQPPFESIPEQSLKELNF